MLNFLWTLTIIQYSQTKQFWKIGDDSVFFFSIFHTKTVTSIIISVPLPPAPSPSPPLPTNDSLHLNKCLRGNCANFAKMSDASRSKYFNQIERENVSFTLQNLPWGLVEKFAISWITERERKRRKEGSGLKGWRVWTALFFVFHKTF